MAAAAEVLDRWDHEVAARTVELLRDRAGAPPSVAEIVQAAGSIRQEREPAHQAIGYGERRPIPAEIRQLLRGFGQESEWRLQHRAKQADDPEERDRIYRRIWEGRLQGEFPTGGEEVVLRTAPAAARCDGVGQEPEVRDGRRVCPGCGSEVE